jgi:hypothetical protein
MHDSELFAITLSRRGDTVYFCTMSGKVSLRPFDGCLQATGGEVFEYVDPLNVLFAQETMELPAVSPLEVITHDRNWLIEAFA